MVVAAGKDKPLTPVQLQKDLFLIGKEWREEWQVAPDSFYEFEPYHYGPFDAQIYADADTLESEGLVLPVPSDQGSWTDTFITINGMKRAEEVETELPEPIANWVREAVHWTQSMSFSGLVRAIYERYPDYRENSIFQS